MKSSIEWHQNCAKNRSRGLDEKRKQLESLEAEISLRAQEINLYLAQIKLAIEEGKDGFDAERYAINRLCV